MIIKSLDHNAKNLFSIANKKVIYIHLVLILQLISTLLMLFQTFLQPLKHQPSKVYYGIID